MRQSPHRPALAVPCLLASASLLGGLLCAETASAAATECPRVGSEYRCVLVDAGSEIAVRVGEQGGGTLELDRWRVAGREQLFFEGFSLRDFTGPDPQEVIVTAALVDPEANDIFVELVSGTLRLSVAFSLQHGATSVVDETIHVTSDLESVSTRLYVVHDFDLDGDAIDGLVFADPSGREIVQTDGPVSARVAWIDGSPPTGSTSRAAANSSPSSSRMRHSSSPAAPRCRARTISNRLSSGTTCSAPGKASRSRCKRPSTSRSRMDGQAASLPEPHWDCWPRDGASAVGHETALAPSATRRR
ncbi:MAG: hypothetical protein M5U32_18865 [Myxococcota bacterium]|nr:hypothetical protein [Myxococcota bacterium]